MKMYDFMGESVTAADLAAAAGCSVPVMKGRLITKSPEDAVALGPVRAGKTYILNGEPKTVSELAELADCSMNVMWNRLERSGMTPEQAISIPVRKRCDEKLYEYAGVSLTTSELAKIAGCSYETMKQRLGKLGKTPAEAVAMGSGKIRTIEIGGKSYTVRQLSAITGMSESWVCSKF